MVKNTKTALTKHGRRMIEAKFTDTPPAGGPRAAARVVSGVGCACQPERKAFFTRAVQRARCSCGPAATVGFLQKVKGKVQIRRDWTVPLTGVKIFKNSHLFSSF